MRSVTAVALVVVAAASCSAPAPDRWTARVSTPGVDGEPFRPAEEVWFGPPMADPPADPDDGPAAESPGTEPDAEEAPISREALEALLPPIARPGGGAEAAPGDGDAIVMFVPEEGPSAAVAPDPTAVEPAVLEFETAPAAERAGERAEWETVEDGEWLSIVEVRYADEPPCDWSATTLPVLVVDGYSSWACGTFTVVTGTGACDPWAVPAGGSCTSYFAYDPCWDPCYDPDYGSWYSWWVDRRVVKDRRRGDDGSARRRDGGPGPIVVRVPEPRRAPDPAPAARPVPFASGVPAVDRRGAVLPRIGDDALPPVRRVAPRPPIVLDGDRDTAHDPAPWNGDHREPFRGAARDGGSRGQDDPGAGASTPAGRDPAPFAGASGGGGRAGGGRAPGRGEPRSGTTEDGAAIGADPAPRRGRPAGPRAEADGDDGGRRRARAADDRDDSPRSRAAARDADDRLDRAAERAALAERMAERAAAREERREERARDPDPPRRDDDGGGSRAGSGGGGRDRGGRDDDGRRGRK